MMSRPFPRSRYQNALSVSLVCVVFTSLLVFVNFGINSADGYEPTWASLDSRPLPGWFDEAKLGIFIHWGVFSVPSYKYVWFWHDWKVNKSPDIVKFMKDNYRPDFTYADFAKDFTAEFFNADEWAELFNSSGAKYVVFVSKHHDGYTNWPSKFSFNWNSMDVGPHRDLVGELSVAVRKYNSSGMKFGLYHSLYEWFHPLYLKDKASGYRTQYFVNEKTLPEMYELVNKYEPDLIWSDGQWEASDEYWKSKQFLAWLYTNSTVKDTVIVNDRWGNTTLLRHGGYFTGPIRHNPRTLQDHKFENSMTIDKLRWGFNRLATASDFYTIKELLQLLVTTVSCGGNLLMNVGPPKYGHIQPIYEERLRQMGQWMKDNGEAIYASKPWTAQNEYGDKIWYTMKKHGKSTTVFAFLFDWPPPSLTLFAPSVTSDTKITLLGYHGNALHFQPMGEQGVVISVPTIPINELPNTWMWTLKMTNIAN